jgi:pimeloyl-ACP methyl ester carboxylesterase
MRTGGRIVGIITALILSACAPAPAPTVPPVPLTTPYPSSPAAPAPTAAPSPTATPVPAPTPAASPIAGGWTFVGRKACPDESRFECITLAVPRDHYVAGGPTWDVTFGIQRATKDRVGTYVVITGGPGSSGIAAADGYTDYYPARIPEHFDIVFIDQRGVGLSHPIQCPVATATYYDSDVPASDPARAAEVGAVAKTYVDTCLIEAGADPADLPFYATRQAIEDLEAIREYLDVDTMHLYGESYGTQFVQTYAAAHPDRIEALYLDGPVDLTLDGASYLAEATRSFDDVLTATLNGCAAEAACAADFEGRNPLAEWDRLDASLAAGGIEFDFPMGDGSTQARTLTAADLENATTGYLYSPGDRAILLRGLAAASDGDLVPLARLAYASIAVDPDTRKAVPDPTYSDAMYYAVECQDYVYNQGAATDDARLAAFLDAGRALGVADARLGDVYYSDMPCLYWPNHPATDPRPAPIVAASYPTVVMVATTDPITPVANAIRIANRLSKVHTIIETGGPHVIFGWGLSCPDDVVADYMVSGKAMPGKITICEGSVSDAHVPLAKDAEADYTDGYDLMTSFVDQVLNSNDYLDMLDADPIRMGCDFGGVLEYTPTDTGTGLRMDACELTDGLPVSGTGTIVDESGAVSLDVTIPDGRLTYADDGGDAVTVTGTFRGAPVTKPG